MSLLPLRPLLATQGGVRSNLPTPTSTATSSAHLGQPALELHHLLRVHQAVLPHVVLHHLRARGPGAGARHGMGKKPRRCR